MLGEMEPRPSIAAMILRLPVLFCVCVLLVASESRAQETKSTPTAPQPGAAEPAPDTGDDAPGVQVPVSLTDGIIKRRLPFDVPFYLIGTAGAEITSIESRVYRIRGKALVTAVVMDLAKTQDCVPKTTGADVTEASRSSWAGAKGSNFVVLVEPLAPQRYYAFCFVTAGPVPAQRSRDRSAADWPTRPH